MIRYVDFYGLYHSNWKNFKFLVGERALILELKMYVHNIIEKETYKYFSMKSAHAKKKGRKLDFSGTFQLKDGKRFFTQTKSLPVFSMTRTDDLKKRLHDNLCNLLISNGAQEDILSKFNEDQAVVTKNDDQTVKGTIVCVLCSETEKNQFRVPYKIEGGKLYWTLSNFQRHLTKSHQLKRESITTKSSKTDDEPNCSNEFSASKRYRYTSPIVPDTSTQNLSREIDGINERIAAESTENNKFDNSEQTTIVLQVDSHKSIEEEIYQQISEQTLRMIEICLNHGSEMTEMKFKIGDGTCSLDVAKVKADGSCLFGALAHQIFGFEITSKAHENSVDQLRAEVVDYIRNNLGLFEFEMKNCIDYQKSKLPKNERNKIIDFQKESNDFLTNQLSKHTFWAGTEALKAISLKYKVNILVFNEDDSLYYVNGFQSQFPKSILLAYRLNHYYGISNSSGGPRNHYDSVVNVDTDILVTISESMASKSFNNVEEDGVIEID